MSTKRKQFAGKVETKKIIERLNKEFSKVLPVEIPLDQPAISHTDEERIVHGWLSWYLVPKDGAGLKMSRAEQRKDAQAAVVGSYHTMSDLLACPTWQLVPEHPEFSDVEKLYRVVINGDTEYKN